MTYEEALYRFIDFAHNQGVTTDIHEEMIATIKEALEKQIPKKPWSQADDDTGLYYHNECPYCGRWLFKRLRPHHCVCGQAIDWEG